MKNIHVLPTDKLSIIGFDSVKNLHFTNDFIDDYQNIYITSDEEIKEGDWFYRDSGTVSILTKELLEYYESIKDKNIHKIYKIILTTDPDLIKDGVQAIDDEFLEWFFKNRNCEEVEVEGSYLDETAFRYNITTYEIIIPKEEPKPHSFCETPEEKCTMNYCDENGCQNRNRVLVEEAKQETQGYICPRTKKQCDDECCVSAEDCHIEASFCIISDCEPSKQETPIDKGEGEAYRQELFNYLYDNFVIIASESEMQEIERIVLSTQQERMYSEEEVLEQLNLLYGMKNSLVDTFTDENDYITMKWFEQFKNK